MYVIIFTNSIRWNHYWSYIVIREDIFYENVTWDGNIKNKIRTIYNCKHCIAVDPILKHNQTGTMLVRVRST